MKLKPKTVRRLALLAAIALIIIVGVIGLFVVRGWQRQRRMVAEKTAGLEFYEKGDYIHAMDHLGQYLRQNMTDADTVLKFARARAKTEESDGRHLEMAIGVYQNYTAMRPSDTAAQLEMIDLCVQRGFWTEAKEAAKKLREGKRIEVGSKDYIKLLKFEIDARGQTEDKDTPEYLELFAELAAAAPLDIRVQINYVLLLVSKDRVADAKAYAKGLREQFPNDPRTELVVLAADYDHRKPNSSQEFFKQLSRLAGLSDNDFGAVRRVSEVTYPTDDDSYVQMLVRLFEGLRPPRCDHSLAVLTDGIKAIHTPELQEALARRAWQRGRGALVVETLANLDPTRADENATLLALKALSLAQIGKSEQALPILEGLKRRTDFRATAWATALPWELGVAKGDLTAAVKDIKQSVRLLPREPILRFMLGVRLMSLARSDEAIRELRIAAGAPGWTMPLLQLCRIYRGQGMLAEATDAARIASEMALNDPSASLNMLQINTARVEAGLPPVLMWINKDMTNPEKIRAIADTADRVANEMKSNRDKPEAAVIFSQILPDRVVLLARSGQTDSAKAVLADAAAVNPPLSADLLNRLAMISLREQLGMEQALLDRADTVAKSGLSTALTRALSMHQQGQTDQALERLRAQAAKAPDEESIPWKMTIARYLDAVANTPERREAARREWVALADGNPDKPGILLEALAVNSVSADAEFIDRTATRLAKLTDADPDAIAPYIKLPRARALLSNQPTKRQRDEAISLLRVVLAELPGHTQARELLVSALLLNDPGRGIDPNVREAIDVLRQAMPRAADPAPVHLRLAQLLQSQRDFAGAKAELTAILKSSAGSVQARLAAVEMLMAQNELEGVAEALTAMRTSSLEPADASRLRLKTIEFYLLSDRKADALALARDTMKSPPTNAADLSQLAVLASESGDENLAKQAADALSKLTLPPGEKEVRLAALAERQRNSEEAEKLYRAAAEAAADRPAGWIPLINFLMRSTDKAKIDQALAAALARHPKDPDLLLLKEQSALLGTPDDKADLRGLIAALKAHPTRAAEAAALEAVLTLREQKKLSDPQALKDLADRFPLDLRVQNQVLRTLVNLEPRDENLRLALPIAQRAMENFPLTSDAARYTVAILSDLVNESRTADDPNREALLRAAISYRQRTLGNEPAANLAIARAFLSLGRPKQSIELLARDLPAAKAKPEGDINTGILSVQAQALVMSDQEPAAFALLEPMLTANSSIRNETWLLLAGRFVKPEAAARRWLEKAEQVADLKLPIERVNLAVAWCAAAQRLSTAGGPRLDAFVTKAQQLLDGIPEAEAAGLVAVWEVRAQIADFRNQPAEAITAYRKVVDLKPRRFVSALRLAQLLVDTKGDGAEAVKLARTAVEASNPSPAPALRVLACAYVLAAAGEADQSSASTDQFRRLAIELIPTLFARSQKEQGDENLAVGDLLVVARIAEGYNQFAVARDYAKFTKDRQSLSPENRRILTNNYIFYLAKAAQQRDELEQARGMINQLIEDGKANRDPNLTYFYSTAAKVAILLTNDSLAIDHTRRSLDLRAKPDEMNNVDADNALQLAELLAASGPSGTAEARTTLALLERVYIGKGNKLTPAQAERLAKVKAKIGG